MLKKRYDGRRTDQGLSKRVESLYFLVTALCRDDTGIVVRRSDIRMYSSKLRVFGVSTSSSLVIWWNAVTPRKVPTVLRRCRSSLVVKTNLLDPLLFYNRRSLPLKENRL